MAQTGVRRTRLPAWVWIAALWAASTAIRFLLAVMMTQNPIIMPDESLYINLSRSVLDGWVALRGQPLTYDSLLYPLFLAPLRALYGRVDFYRAAQLLNAAAISLSVVPAWLLARDVTNDERKALLVAGLTDVMSDFAISQILMAESLCYPLALTALWLIYRALGDQGTAGGAALAGLASGLCYMAKPGYAALGGVLCALLMIRTARREEGALIQALAAVTAFASVIALTRLIGLKLSIDYSWKSVYQSQTPLLTWGTALQALQGSLLYLYFLPVALLAFPAILPVAGYGRLDRGERGLAVAVLCVAAAMILGTCYAVSISEYSGQPFVARVHMRYFSFVAPALLALSLSPRLDGFRLNRRAAAMLALLIAASVAFTPRALLSGKSYMVDALALAFVTGDWPQTDPKALFQLFAIGWILAGGYVLATTGWTKQFKRWALGALAVFMLVNNLAGYDLLRHNEDPEWATDARQAATWMDGQDALFVAGGRPVLLEPGHRAGGPDTKAAKRHRIGRPDGKHRRGRRLPALFAPKLLGDPGRQDDRDAQIPGAGQQSIVRRRAEAGRFPFCHGQRALYVRRAPGRRGLGAQRAVRPRLRLGGGRLEADRVRSNPVRWEAADRAAQGVCGRIRRSADRNRRRSDRAVFAGRRRSLGSAHLRHPGRRPESDPSAHRRG